MSGEDITGNLCSFSLLEVLLSNTKEMVDNQFRESILTTNDDDFVFWTSTRHSCFEDNLQGEIDTLS